MTAATVVCFVRHGVADLRKEKLQFLSAAGHDGDPPVVTAERDDDKRQKHEVRDREGERH